MDRDADDTVERCLGQLLRHPEPLRDIAVERALVRLQAARADAAYLLLHRVLVLETALQTLAPPQARQATPAVAATPPASAGLAPAPAGTTAFRPSPRSFVRDAATVAAGVAAGVVTGQAVWQALEGDAGADDAQGPDFGFEL